jgi:carbonic anhydrase
MKRSYFANSTLSLVIAAGTVCLCAGTALTSPPAHENTTPTKPSVTPSKKATKTKPIINLPKYDDTKGGDSQGTKPAEAATGGSTPPVPTPAHADGHGHADPAKDGAHAAGHDDHGDHGDHGDQANQAGKSGHTAILVTHTNHDTHANVSSGTGNSGATEALQWLQEGNQRWVENKSTAPNTTLERMNETATNGQKPFVTIVTCSDSRIPVERVFDRGVGELFVVRVAGNRAAGSETGTVEYGVGHLHTPLLMIMGHTKCGAVAAAASGAKLHGKVGELVAGIQPAVDRARKHNPGADEATLTALAVRENVWQTVFDLYKSSPEVRDAVAAGKVKVVGALYDISTGKVEFMGEHPWQSELITALAPVTPAGGQGATAAVDEHK